VGAEVSAQGDSRAGGNDGTINLAAHEEMGVIPAGGDDRFRGEDLRGQVG
jgi:hypothetical protein